MAPHATEAMPKKEKPIEQYAHADKERVNNPPVGLVNATSDPDTGKKKNYAYDPHLDPALQWAGKEEHTSFEVDTVSLHVHERIDPKTIIKGLQKDPPKERQTSLFGEEQPLRKAVEFYKHRQNWTNRLIAGDSLLVMNSLLEKEGMGGGVQMVYFDPPYGIKYGSNFQPYINKRDVKDGKDEDLTTEPEMIKAFRDTWELGIHSYLSYIRDRLLLARELLADSGSVFVQISDENVHRVRMVMDEVFGAENFLNLVAVSRTSARGTGTSEMDAVADYLVQYAKDKEQAKRKRLYRAVDEKGKEKEMLPFRYIQLKDGSRRPMTREEMNDPSTLPQGARRYRLTSLSSQTKSESSSFVFEWNGEKYTPHSKRGWACSEHGMRVLAEKGFVQRQGSNLCYLKFHDERPGIAYTNQWTDTGSITGDKRYVVETATKIVERCVLMTTDPGDVVLDITCGSGTTAYVAEQWGRRWVTCDTSRIATALAKQRLMTSVFDYYKLALPNEGVGGGFAYETAPHITLKSLANNQPPATETLYDRPKKDSKRARVAGPFTVEAVPSLYAEGVHELGQKAVSGDAEMEAFVARQGDNYRIQLWREELLKTGVRAKSGERLRFSRVEGVVASKYVHAEAETLEGEDGEKPKRVYVVFGPEYAPLDRRLVDASLDEIEMMRPRPALILFVAFSFDPEAAKDISETTWHGITLLQARMNEDLLTEDLRKKDRGNESFWLVGEPDIKLESVADGKKVVEVIGFDYFNPRTDRIESEDADKIALWMLDTDYDGRSLYPSQVFFPLAGKGDGWGRVESSLRAEIDKEKVEVFRGTKSLPFEPGNRIAVKIVDDRGIESLQVLNV